MILRSNASFENLLKTWTTISFFFLFYVLPNNIHGWVEIAEMAIPSIVVDFTLLFKLLQMS